MNVELPAGVFWNNIQAGSCSQERRNIQCVVEGGCASAARSDSCVTLRGRVSGRVPLYVLLYVQCIDVNLYECASPRRAHIHACLFEHVKKCYVYIS